LRPEHLSHRCGASLSVALGKVAIQSSGRCGHGLSRVGLAFLVNGLPAKTTESEARCRTGARRWYIPAVFARTPLSRGGLTRASSPQRAAWCGAEDVTHRSGPRTSSAPLAGLLKKKTAT